jgi:hypothetical protein
VAGRLASLPQGRKRNVSVLGVLLPLADRFHCGAEIPGDHPRLEGDGRLARTMRFADVEALEAVIRAWCDWKAG